MGFYYILLVNFLIVLRFSTSFIIATLISQDSHTSTSVSLESAFDTTQAISTMDVTLIVSLCCVQRMKTKGKKGYREEKEKEEYNGVSLAFD